MNKKPVVCMFTGSSGDWGGASRVLYTMLRQIDTSRVAPLLLLPSEGPIIEDLRRHGLRYIVWGALNEPGQLISYARSFLRTVSLLRRERVTAVYISTTFWRPAELLAAMFLRIPILGHYHLVVDNPGPFARFFRAAIAVSKYVAANSLPTKLERPVIYNPVNLDRFDGGRSVRNALGVADSDVVISFLGQIRDIKGVEDFIAMAHGISNPNVRFLISGECRDPRKQPGSYSVDELESMIDGDSRIKYLGYVERVEDIYHSSDIIVMPSRWQEPLGLVPIEAGACRKPVVATRVGGIPEVVSDEVNGFLVEPQDVSSMIESVTRLVNDPDLRRRMGEAGRRYVEQELTWRPVRQFEAFLVRFSRA